MEAFVVLKVGETSVGQTADEAFVALLQDAHCGRALIHMETVGEYTENGSDDLLYSLHLDVSIRHDIPKSNFIVARISTHGAGPGALNKNWDSYPVLKAQLS